MMPQPQILRRTFEAKKHPHHSPERIAANTDALTSEFYPSQPWLVRRPFVMGDGTPHPTQPFINTPFRTKAEAEKHLASTTP